MCLQRVFFMCSFQVWIKFKTKQSQPTKQINKKIYIQWENERSLCCIFKKSQVVLEMLPLVMGFPQCSAGNEGGAGGSASLPITALLSSGTALLSISPSQKLLFPLPPHNLHHASEVYSLRSGTEICAVQWVSSLEWSYGYLLPVVPCVLLVHYPSWHCFILLLLCHSWIIWCWEVHTTVTLSGFSLMMCQEHQ